MKTVHAFQVGKACEAAAILLLLALAPVLSAQDRAAAATRYQGLMLNDPSLRSLFRSELPQISFLIGEDEKTGKIQIGNAKGPNAWTLALAGPLDENNDRTEFFGDDGLGNAVNIEFGYKRTFLGTDPAPNSRELTNANLKMRARAAGADTARLSVAERAAMDAGSTIAKRILSFSAKTSRKKFEFANATTLAEDDLQKTGHSFSAGAIHIFDSDRISPSLLYAIGLTLKRASSYKAADGVHICEPASVAGAELCRETPLGGPTNTKKWVGQVETRQFIGDTIALAPRITYTKVDGNGDDVWSAELPIYLRNEIDAPFQGGIALRYDTKSEDYSIAFFIGAMGMLN